MDPDEVAGSVVNGLGEAFVDALVDVDIGQSERNLVQQVMEEWPDDAVADAFVSPSGGVLATARLGAAAIRRAGHRVQAQGFNGLT